MAVPPHRRACIAGVGQTRYTRWGGITDASEHALALEAILDAVADAGFDVDEVDGLTSFAADRNEAVFLAADMGLPELRFANMVWSPAAVAGARPSPTRRWPSRRGRPRSSSRIGVASGFQEVFQAAVFSGEVTHRAPREVARDGVSRLPPAHGRDSHRDRVRELFLCHSELVAHATDRMLGALHYRPIAVER
jgi:hypothetical protein